MVVLCTPPSGVKSTHDKYPTRWIYLFQTKSSVIPSPSYKRCAIIALAGPLAQIHSAQELQHPSVSGHSSLSVGTFKQEGERKSVSVSKLLVQKSAHNLGKHNGYHVQKCQGMPLGQVASGCGPGSNCEDSSLKMSAAVPEIREGVPFGEGQPHNIGDLLESWISLTKSVTPSIGLQLLPHDCIYHYISLSFTVSKINNIYYALDHDVRKQLVKEVVNKVVQLLGRVFFE